MHFERDRLELVNPSDKRAARVIRRYKSKLLYGADYYGPKYQLPIFILGCFGYTFVFLSAIGLWTSTTTAPTGFAILITAAIMAIPQTIYWDMTKVNESRLEKLIEEGRVVYHG